VNALRRSSGSNTDESITVVEDEDKITEEAIEKMMEPLGAGEGREVGNKIQITLNDLLQLSAESNWNKEVMVEEVNEVMALMTVKKQEQGSVGEDRKHKSLKQRWFALEGDKVIINKAGEEKDFVGPQSKAIIERDVVVSLEGGDHALMGMFNNHDGLRPAPALRVSRFEAIPTTCFHNVVSEEDEDVDIADCCFSTIIASTGNQIRITNFARGAEELSLQDTVVIRPADANANGEGRLDWLYGHDVTQAVALANPESHFTKKDCSFERIERKDYRLQVRQKIGIALYRNFTIMCEDVGIPPRQRRR